MYKHFYILFFSLTLFLNANQGTSKNEINHLLNYVEHTPCYYIRNADKHTGKSAREHIEKKYDYYKEDIHSTEDFIRLSASKSTLSGSPYYIQCQNKAKIKSAKWLLDELKRYRDQH